MRSYLSLVSISARVHRRQSRMTRFCIVLAVFLVTSVFSMAEMLIRAEQTELMNKHGNYHIVLKDVPYDRAEEIGKRPDVAVFSRYGEINADTEKDYYLGGKNAVLYGVEETYLTDIMNYPMEGSYPEDDNEIALSADAKELFGIGIGDSVTLNTPMGDFEFTVSAFYEDDTEFNDIIDGSCVYMNRSVFQTICISNGEDADTWYYVRFTENTNLKKAIAGVKEQYGLADENVDENMAVLGLQGASSNQTVQNIYPLAAACFVLILFAGIFMISSCMNSNVAQRTSFFGMMRCIGASKKQIVRFVRLEALNWCKSAIPAGCLLGMATCWILCAILRFLVKGEWVDMPLFGVSISGILCGIAVGIITVFIAAHSPAKQAAKVSPIAAVSGNAQGIKTAGRAADIRHLKMETSLGIRHATAVKKNLLLMIGSFALPIILFLAFSACLDIVQKLIPSETNFSPDVGITSQDNTNSIDRNLAGELSEIPGVKSVFGTMYEIGLPARINDNETVIDLVTYEDFMLDSKKKSVASGDLSKVYGDSGYVLTIFDEDSRYNVGDQVKIGDYELEIACVASEGIGSVSGSPVIVCSEETFMRLTGESRYMMINVILDKGAGEETVDQIRGLAGSHTFLDRREELQMVHGSYWVLRLGAYGFLAIIFLVMILNIMNSVSMGVSARIKQYGVMRAVGMESRQIIKMITAEAVTYAFCGTVVGMIAGLALHYLIYIKLLITHFGGRWEIPFSTMAVIFALGAVSCVAAVKAPARRIRGMAITDTINEL